MKSQQCQTILCSSLRSSKDDAIKNFWKVTNCGNNIQYDTYQNTKQVLKSIRDDHTERLKSKLPSQGFIITFLLDRSLKNRNQLWSKAQSKLPTNIFNFTLKYLNNTLTTRNNLCLWKLAASPDCFFCLQSESLLHIVAGCKSYLEQGRFAWRHNSASKFLAQTLESVKSSNLYVDLQGYLSPCIITGDSHDMLLITADKCLYIIELTVGFETNLDNNSERKEFKYRPLLRDLGNKYRLVKFVNLSISCLGIFGQSSDSFLQMCKEVDIDQCHRNFVISKMSSIVIHTTHYIFCMRNKQWTNPELLCY